MPRIVIRFDVDTPRCVGAGMADLNQVAREFDVPFVYFINFGRAVDLFARIGRHGQASGEPTAAKLGSFRKQGFAQIAHLLLRNPRLMDVGIRNILEADAQGAEIGVHGGRNHGSWQWGYAHWSESRIAEEVDWSTRQYERILNRSPSGFSSPGWASDDRLPPVLAAAGYRYFADRHGSTQHAASGPLHNFTTRLTGEPGGVGFLESCVARSLDGDAVIAELERAAADSEDPLVLYDHPSFAARGGLSILRKIIMHVKAQQWTICTFADVLEISVP